MELQDITSENWKAWFLAGSICVGLLAGVAWCLWKAIQKAKEFDRPTGSIEPTNYDNPV